MGLEPAYAKRASAIRRAAGHLKGERREEAILRLYQSSTRAVLRFHGKRMLRCKRA